MNTVRKLQLWIKFPTMQQHAVIILFVSSVCGYMLKDLSCSLVDAEFGNIRYGSRLLQGVLSTLSLIGLRQCLTKCLTHPTCKSVNYNRKNQLCDLLGVNLHCGGGGWQGFLIANSHGTISIQLIKMR